MNKNITVGIDIGTHQIKVVIAEANPKGLPTVLGVGFSESKGLRHGYIIHIQDTAASIRQAVAQAEKSSGIKIKEAYISIGGIGLGSLVSHGQSTITKADLEITKLDIEKAIEVSQTNIPTSSILNKKIVYTIPIGYKIDNKLSLGDPEGMHGAKLEVKTLFITCLEHHFHDIVRAAEEAGISILDIIAAPIAASIVTLNNAQKTAGCVLANIGAETVSIVVYENSIPISLEVFPVGSNDITNDIALGLKIPLEEADKLKLGSTGNYPKKRLEEIIVARLSDMFELIETHLKKIDKNGLLPAGIVITGGGSRVATIEDLAKAYLKLPSRVTGPLVGQNTNSKIQVKDPMWSVAYGLCVLGFLNDDEYAIKIGWGPKFIKPMKNSFVKWITQFLP